MVALFMLNILYSCSVDSSPVSFAVSASGTRAVRGGGSRRGERAEKKFQKPLAGEEKAGSFPAAFETAGWVKRKGVSSSGERRRKQPKEKERKLLTGEGK